MAEMDFRCGQCNNPLKAPDDSKGAVCTCPNCAAEYVIQIRYDSKDGTPSRPEILLTRRGRA